jgi:hypothetical protein
MNTSPEDPLSEKWKDFDVTNAIGLILLSSCCVSCGRTRPDSSDGTPDDGITFAAASHSSSYETERVEVRQSVLGSERLRGKAWSITRLFGIFRRR